MKKALVVLLGFIIFGALSQLIAGHGSTQSKPNTPTAEEQQVQATELQERLSLAKAALVLRNGMKNPPSFVMTSAMVTDQKAMCFEYRATNSFGGVVPGYTAINPAGNVFSTPTGWNKYCAGKSGIQRQTEINAVLKKTWNRSTL